MFESTSWIFDWTWATMDEILSLPLPLGVVGIVNVSPSACASVVVSRGDIDESAGVVAVSAAAVVVGDGEAAAGASSPAAAANTAHGSASLLAAASAALPAGVPLSFSFLSSPFNARSSRLALGNGSSNSSVAGMPFGGGVGEWADCIILSLVVSSVRRHLFLAELDLLRRNLRMAGS